MNRPGLLSEIFTQIKDRPALYKKREDIDAQLRMLRNPNLGGGSPEEVSPQVVSTKVVSPQGGSPQVVSPQSGSLENVSLQAVSTPSSTSDDPLLEMSVEQEQPERGATYIPSDEVDTFGFDPSIPIASFNQQAGNIVKNKPATEKFITSFGKEISDFRKTLDERVEKKRNTAQRRKDSIERDKFLAVAQMGLNILAQDGGQTFLQAIGKGSKNVIPTLMKLSREEFKIADNLDDLDFETAKAKFGLTEAEFNRYVKQRGLDIAARKVRAEEAKVGATIGSGLTLGEVGNYVSSLTTLPSNTLERNKIITFVDQKVRRDALIGLTAVQRADDSTVKESMRRLLNDSQYMKNIFSMFTKQTGESLPQTIGNGAPAGNKPERPTAVDVISNTQKGLRDQRTKS
jgi:hypothetical protein